MAKKSSISDALRLLDLPDATDKSSVKRKYRELAKMHHPDRFIGYTERAHNAEEFMDIQAAYALLMSLPGDRIMSKRNIDEERILVKNPNRGTYTLPDWIIILELKNSIYFFRMLYKKAPAFGVLFTKWIQSIFSNKSTQGSPSSTPRMGNKLIKGLRWLVVSLSYLIIFVCGFLFICSIALCFIIFYLFLYLGKIINRATFKAIYQRYGYYPSATCGNTKGEITYLIFKTIHTLTWCVLSYYALGMLYHIAWEFLFVFMPLGLFALILVSSTLYEWICFVKVHQQKVN